MSGATAIARSHKPKPGPIERKLSVEDDRRLFRFLGVGQVAGAWFVAWALTVHIVIPEIPYEPPIDPRGFTFDPTPRRIPGSLKPLPKNPVVKSRPRENDAPRPSSRNPVEENGQIKVEVIASKQDDWGKQAYGIIENALKGVDMEKIEGAGRLTRTDPTRIADGRKGVKREGYDEPYSETGTGKTGLGILPAIKPGRIDGGGLKGARTGELTGPATSFTVSNEGRFRSSEDILAVVRSHSPGLRHLYNTHLKLNPGLGGKVTVRFAISPSGRVVDAATVSATTGSRRFEEQVLEKIQTWRFEAIKAVGNDIVTVPFNFSE